MGTTIAVRQLKQGMEGAEAPQARPRCEDLLARYQPRIRLVCRRLAGDDAVWMESLASVTLARVLRALPGLVAPRGRTGRRILELARRTAFEAIRQPGELLIEDGLVAARSPMAQRLGELSWTERRGWVRRAFSRFEPDVRAAGELRYVDNLPWRAVDAWLGSPEPGRRLARERASAAGEFERLMA